MPNARYALEKLFQAVDTLVTGSGRVHERLGTAAMKLLPARPGDIPYDDLRRAFEVSAGAFDRGFIARRRREMTDFDTAATSADDSVYVGPFSQADPHSKAAL